MLALCGAWPALASPTFVDLVPNGAAHSCLTCHLQDEGGEGWNDFGQELLEAGGANPDANPDDQNAGYSGSPTWSDVCDLDSDGDGYGNGEELGDPECVWVDGDEDPAGSVTNPGDARDFPGEASLCAAAGGRSVTMAALPMLAAWLVRRRRRPVSSRSS